MFATLPQRPMTLLSFKKSTYLSHWQVFMVEWVHQELHATHREGSVVTDEHHQELGSHLRILPVAAWKKGIRHNVLLMSSNVWAHRSIQYQSVMITWQASHNIIAYVRNLNYNIVRLLYTCRILNFSFTSNNHIRVLFKFVFFGYRE